MLSRSFVVLALILTPMTVIAQKPSEEKDKPYGGRFVIDGNAVFKGLATPPSPYAPSSPGLEIMRLSAPLSPGLTAFASKLDAVCEHDNNSGRCTALRLAASELVRGTRRTENKPIFDYLLAVADALLAEKDQRNTLFPTKDDILAKYKIYVKAPELYIGAFAAYAKEVQKPGVTAGELLFEKTTHSYFTSLDEYKNKPDEAEKRVHELLEADVPGDEALFREL